MDIVQYGLYRTLKSNIGNSPSNIYIMHKNMDGFILLCLTYAFPFEGQATSPFFNWIASMHGCVVALVCPCVCVSVCPQ